MGVKLSKDTIEVLKNFAAINPSIVVAAGKKIKTMSPAKTIVATAEIEEEFPRDFAIYDLNQFLGVVGMFQDAELSFGKDKVEIGNGRASVVYVYSSPDNIVALTKEIAAPNFDVEFDLEPDALQGVIKASGLLSLGELVIEVKKGKILLCAVDVKNPTSNKFQQEVGKTDVADTRRIFKVDNVKLLKRTFAVSLSSVGLARFKDKNGSLTYWVAVEADK